MTLDKLLLQVRRIAGHRELGAEKKIRAAYKQCLKELKQFIGYEYATLAENGKLTYGILAKKQEQARFLEEVQRHIDRVAPEIRNEMTQLVSSVYNLSYNGMIEAAASSVPSEVSSALKGLSYVQPMQVKSGVDNTLINKIMLNDVLEKNRKGVIYDLKQAINIGITNGETVDMVAKRISKTLDGDYKKSVRVARTEVHRVREAGLSEGAKDFDMQLQEADTGMRMAKIWRTMKDNRVRPNVVHKSKKGTVTKMGHGANHIQMEGQTVLADEQFELSDGNMTDAPGQSGIASQDINCRCFVRYKLVTEKEYMQLTGKNFEGKIFTNADDSDIIRKEKFLRIPQIPSSTVRRKIDAGEYATKLSTQQYNKHIIGTPQYNSYLESRKKKGGNPQSVLTISESEVQKIIEVKAGTGIVKVDRKGSQKPQEDISLSFVIGEYYGNGSYHKTNKATIHYGKKMSHLVPIKGDYYD